MLYTQGQVDRLLAAKDAHLTALAAQVALLVEERKGLLDRLLAREGLEPLHATLPRQEATPSRQTDPLDWKQAAIAQERQDWERHVERLRVMAQDDPAGFLEEYEVEKARFDAAQAEYAAELGG